MSRTGTLQTKVEMPVETSGRAGQKTSENGHIKACPECEGEIVHQGSEHNCEECGLVVRETTINRGPEWRASSAAEQNERARCGPPVTETLHDKGLTTEIDWRNKDANGNYLNERQRRQARKNRRAQRYSKTSQSKEKSHRDGLGEVSRMCSALGVKQHVKKCACRLYQQCVDEGILPGWSIEDVSTAALKIALDQCGQPRDIIDILSVSQAPKTKVLRAQKQILGEFDIWDSVVPNEDELRREIVQHIRRLSSDCEASTEVEQATIDLLDEVDYAQLGDGRKPMSHAAALLFETGRLLGAPDAPTQQEIEDAGGPCKKTIRTTANTLLDSINQETQNTIAKRD